MNEWDSKECAACWAKPGSPTLCDACLHNRNVASRLRRAFEQIAAGEKREADLKARLKAVRTKFLRHIEKSCDTSGYGPPRDLFERATDLRRHEWRHYLGTSLWSSTIKETHHLLKGVKFKKARKP